MVPTLCEPRRLAVPVMCLAITLATVTGCTSYRAGDRARLAIGHAPSQHGGELQQPAPDTPLALGTRTTLAVRGLVTDPAHATSSQSLEGTGKHVNTGNLPGVATVTSEDPGVVRVIEISDGAVTVEAVSVGQTAITVDTGMDDDRFTLEVAAPARLELVPTSHATAESVGHLLRTGVAQGALTRDLLDTANAADTPTDLRATIEATTHWPPSLVEALERGTPYLAGSTVTFDLVRRASDGSRLVGRGGGEPVALVPTTLGDVVSDTSDQDQVRVRFDTAGDGELEVGGERRPVRVVEPQAVVTTAILTAPMDDEADADGLLLAWLLLQTSAGELALLGDDPSMVRSATPAACQVESYAALRPGAAHDGDAATRDSSLDALLLLIFDVALGPNGLLLKAHSDDDCVVEVSIGAAVKTFRLPSPRALAIDSPQRFDPIATEGGD